MSQNLDKPSGIIFVCNNATKEECLQRQIFGLPDVYLEMVKMITPGMHLFLFNSSNRELVGGFTAASHGGYALCSSAFRGDFPAQVKIKIMVPALPSISEDRYRSILDYFREKRFKYVLDDSQVKQLFVLFDEEMKRKQMVQNHFGSGRSNTTTALTLPTVHGPRMASIPQLASQWRPVNRPVKYTLETSDGFGRKGGMDMRSSSVRGMEPTLNQMQPGMKTSSSCLELEIEKNMEIIDLNTIDNLLSKTENRTTVVIYPIPPIEKCQVTSLIAILDTSHSHRYQFIMLKNEYERALYVDMKSPDEVIRLFMRFQDKTWNQISSDVIDFISKPKIGFWKEAQGIAQLAKKFEANSRWISHEPALCFNLSENIPYIFLNSENEQYMPESLKNPIIDTDMLSPDGLGIDRPTEPERMSINCTRGLFFVEQGNILKFQYHELLKNIFEIKKEHQNDPNPIINIDSDVVQEFMHKKTLERAKEDFQKLKQDIKEILKLRYSPEFYIDSPHYNFYCDVYRKVCEYIDQEYIVDEVDLF